MPENLIKRRYRMQRSNSRQRGITFNLTFDEWLKIWTDSGHLHENGKHLGQYCMARRRDQGAYEVGNVRIITVEQNHSEMRHTEETKRKMRNDRAGAGNSNYRHGRKVGTFKRKIDSLAEDLPAAYGNWKRVLET